MKLNTKNFRAGRLHIKGDGNRSIYQKYLHRLGLILAAISLMSMFLLLCIWRVIPNILAKYHVSTLLTALLIPFSVGILSYVYAQREKGRKALLVLFGFSILAEGFLLIRLGGRSVDALIDPFLFIMGLCFYLLALSSRRSMRWSRILQQSPRTLDLRISGKNELFDPLVMAPHLEVNSAIITAVDHFLETEEASAPLHLTIHSAEPVSNTLQELMIEGFREHYADDEKQVNRFLEERFTRSIALITIGVIILSILKYIGGETSSSTVWIIVSNYAAFSLWQVGSTYFERASVMPRLARIFIARHATITFR